jgi:transketolase
MTAGQAESARLLARTIRRESLVMTSLAGTSHVGSALSCADVLAVLYASVMAHRPDQPRWPERDRFIMSKGHAAVALYACLSASGYFGGEVLESYGTDGTRLVGHVTSGLLPGIEASAGSLGHGLPQACGISFALRHQGSSARVFCLMSDGECQEGAVWEAAIMSAQWRLANLHVIIDANGQQGLGDVADIAGLEPLAEKWAAFGWNVRTVDGHDCEALAKSLSRVDELRPCVTIARTLKGKGVSFMEGQLKWHYASPTPGDLEVALAELDLQ